MVDGPPHRCFTVQKQVLKKNAPKKKIGPSARKQVKSKNCPKRLFFGLKNVQNFKSSIKKKSKNFKFFSKLLFGQIRSEKNIFPLSWGTSSMPSDIPPPLLKMNHDKKVRKPSIEMGTNKVKKWGCRTGLVFQIWTFNSSRLGKKIEPL